MAAANGTKVKTEEGVARAGRLRTTSDSEFTSSQSVTVSEQTLRESALLFSSLSFKKLFIFQRKKKKESIIIEKILWEHFLQTLP